MPAALTYPGVYVEELPSGVHTITGVATSIAAFIGWAPKGPIDHAVLVESWSEFDNQYGGLNSKLVSRIRDKRVLRERRLAGLYHPARLGGHHRPAASRRTWTTWAAR